MSESRITHVHAHHRYPDQWMHIIAILISGCHTFHHLGL